MLVKEIRLFLTVYATDNSNWNSDFRTIKKAEKPEFIFLEPCQTDG